MNHRKMIIELEVSDEFLTDERRETEEQGWEGTLTVLTSVIRDALDEEWGEEKPADSVRMGNTAWVNDCDMS